VPGVSLKGLSRRYGDVAAVDNLSLEVKPGELVALLGPSGCGKTTTLRLVAGFLAPEAGEIWVGDRCLSSPRTVVPPERRRMAMIFQSYALWPHMTVAQNVAYGLRFKRGLAAADRDRRVAEMLRVVQLAGYEARYPGELSGGQQQRVAVARALVVEPEILLLDEPLSNLDANLREEMRFEIRRLHEAFGITTLYVTHDQAEALSLSTRIAVLSNGTLVQEGRPEEIYWKPRNAFVAEFVGAANLVPVRVVELRDMGVVVETRGGARLPVGSGAHVWSMGDAALLCLRPEALRVEEAALAPGGIPGTVSAHVFEGSRQLYDVSIPGGTIKVEMITSALVGRSFKLGDHVRVEVSPETSILLPDDRTAA
jgi:iron(III) transport system ATP-binding protein